MRNKHLNTFTKSTHIHCIIQVPFSYIKLACHSDKYPYSICKQYQTLFVLRGIDQEMLK